MTNWPQHPSAHPGARPRSAAHPPATPPDCAVPRRRCPAAAPSLRNALRVPGAGCRFLISRIGHFVAPGQVHPKLKTLQLPPVRRGSDPHASECTSPEPAVIHGTRQVPASTGDSFKAAARMSRKAIRAAREERERPHFIQRQNGVGRRAGSPLHRLPSSIKPHYASDTSVSVLFENLPQALHGQRLRDVSAEATHGHRLEQ
jgi:hypothetical protein